MKKTLLMAALAAAVVGGALGCGGKSAPPSIGTFTDTRDGKVYKIVEINGQTWFAENLNYAAEGSRCYGEDDRVLVDWDEITTISTAEVETNCAKYGRLYNWHTAKKACPAGTHLPSSAEWTRLFKYAGGNLEAGTKLKSTTGWKDDRNGTDEYGFSALPGGCYGNGGIFFYAGTMGFWWSATAESVRSERVRKIYNKIARIMGFWWSDIGKSAHRSAWVREMYYNSESIGSNTSDKIDNLHSVRCVVDK